MPKNCRRWLKSINFFVVLAGLGCGASKVRAQQVRAPDAQVSAPQLSKTTTLLTEHRFWDKENDLLFAGVAATRTLDYFSTLNMRRRGRQEIFLTNDAVDNHAGFAFIEVGATGVSIGAAYFFHRYGHHKLERWTSIVHIGLAGTGAIRNYSLKTAHF
ncbi:MAG: hypothetical protein M3P45_06205 [Acidobacteriota bacterium]|nr:hypothetical protein [Acidobacteriota bacterium]